MTAAREYRFSGLTPIPFIKRVCEEFDWVVLFLCREKSVYLWIGFLQLAAGIKQLIWKLVGATGVQRHINQI